MDKNNKKNDRPGNLDNMRLKDHLNASFDIDNIKVSEDLIARTLKSIGESGLQEEQPKESNKIKHFPVRRLVSAAAVIIVLIVGINVLQNGLGSSKTESPISLDDGTAGKMAAGNGTKSNSTFGTEEDAAADTVTSDTAAADMEDPAPEEGITPFSSEVSKNVNKEDERVAGSFSEGTLFSGLYPITFASVEKFTVSKNDGTEKTFTDAGDKVSELYTVMDGYSLTTSNTKTDGNENNWTYKTLITTTDKQTYTILFSDEIQVIQSNETTESTPFIYSVGDMGNLLKQVDEFYISLK
ncbi:MAG: hypothetical protein WCD89_17795 [Anaerocolumna sp.]